MTTVEETKAPGTVPVAGIVVLATGVGLMAALSWQAAGHLPDVVTFAGTGRHGADQHAPKAFVLTMMPLLSLAIAAVTLAAQRIRRGAAAVTNIPLWRDARTHRRAVDVGLGVVVPVLLALHLVILRAAEGQAGSGMPYVAAAVALLVVVIGNVWPKQVPKVPDMLRGRLDPVAQQELDGRLEAQRRNQRPTGVVMILLGLVALACSWLTPQISLGLALSAIVVQGGVLVTTGLRGRR